MQTGSICAVFQLPLYLNTWAVNTFFASVWCYGRKLENLR